MIEITKVSSKGQIVIPARIREELKLDEGSVVAISRSGNVAMLKKLSVDEAMNEFDRLTDMGKQFADRKGIRNEDDLNKIIHERRKKRRAEGSS